MNTLAEAGRRLRRPAAAYAAAACVVALVGAALRFHGLGDYSLGGDEAQAAVNAQGSFADLVSATRRRNSSPILYPVLLWLVQKVEISNFSVRFLPAAAGSLTVAALLALLPGAGVPRRAALFAGLLQALSLAALFESRGVREYGLDALVAALLIVGLLRWIRDGRGRGLLASGLVLGPLVQYGLVLFGMAVLATALAFSDGRARPRREGGVVPGPVGRARAGVRLLPPAAFFAAACGISFLTTARYQMTAFGLDLSPGGAVVGHLRPQYFGGGLTDFFGAASFAVSQAWRLLDAHLAPPLAASTLIGAGGLLLWSASARRRDSTDGGGGVVGGLLAVSFLVAAGAAVVGIYPFTPGRHGVYLGPVICTAAGAALAGIVERLGALARSKWPGNALFAVTAVGIAFVGAREIRAETEFEGAGTVEEVVALLAAEVRPDDWVAVVGHHPRANLDFYRPSWPKNWFRARKCGFDLTCADEVVRAARSLREPPRRVFVVTGWDEGPWFSESLHGYHEEVRLRPLVAKKGVAWRQWGGDLRLYRLDEPIAGEESRLRAAPLRDYGRPGREEPTVRSHWEIRRREDALVYRRAPCSAADTEAQFSLEFHASPEATARGARPREHRDFVFEAYGFRRGNECLAIFPIPTGDFSKVETGQSSPAARWRETVRLDGGIYRAAFRSIRAGAWAPAARSAFALHSRDGFLWYHRAPCSREDTESRFFLHLYPRAVSDLPADRAIHGFENRDFDFPDEGVFREGGCLARVRLPDYEIARLRTGQFRSGSGPLWSVEVSPN